MKHLSLSTKIVITLSLLSVIFFGYYFISGTFYGGNTYHKVSNPIIGTTVLNQDLSPSIKLLFVGDMMFDRYIRKMALRHGEDFLFSCIDPLLMKHDVVIGNLEGPITTKPSTSMGTKVGSPENYYFTFPTSTASLLFKHNIKLVSIGNNHIDNQKAEGILQTKKFLRDSNVAFFGGLLGDSPVYRTTDNKIPISFINYNQFGGDKEDVVARTIFEEKSQGRIVIVYAHWGEEYQDVVAPVLRTAKHFAESGADIIIGSHPHIVQSHEVIGTTIVYYSLGNFIFDQYFQPEVTEGLALSVEVSSKGVMSVHEHPVKMNKDGRTCPREK